MLITKSLQEKKMKGFTYIITSAALLFSVMLHSQEVVPETYINPLDIDYTYMVDNSSKEYFLPVRSRSCGNRI